MEFGSHRTYVDGVVKLNTDKGAYGMSDGSDIDLVVGGLIGVMDEVRIYDRVLTDAEIATIAAEP